MRKEKGRPQGVSIRKVSTHSLETGFIKFREENDCKFIKRQMRCKEAKVETSRRTVVRKREDTHNRGQGNRRGRRIKK